MHFCLFRYVEYVVIKVKMQRLSSKVKGQVKEVRVKVKVNSKLDIDLCPLIELDS